MDTPRRVKTFVENNPWMWGLIVGASFGAGVIAWIDRSRFEVLNDTIRLLETDREELSDYADVPLDLLVERIAISKAVYEKSIETFQIGVASINDVLSSHRELVNAEISLEIRSGEKRITLIEALDRVGSLKRMVGRMTENGVVGEHVGNRVLQHENELKILLAKAN